jgi:predicted transcriptional regulator
MSAMENEQRRGRPSRTKDETLEIRKRIVDLSHEGYTERAIAAEIGFAPSAVHQHLVIYRESLTPSTELAEEWRNTKLARAAS